MDQPGPRGIISIVRMEVRNRLTMLRHIVAMRKEQTSTGRAGWIAIYPLQAPRTGYNVRSFEVDEGLLAHPEQIWDGVMHDLRASEVATIEEAEAWIVELGEDPERLDAPWHVDFPV